MHECPECGKDCDCEGGEANCLHPTTDDCNFEDWVYDDYDDFYGDDEY